MRTWSLIRYFPADELYIWAIRDQYPFLYRGKYFLTTKSVVNPVFWHHMEEYGVTILSGVPYAYECMRKMNVLAKGLAKLRLMTQAGGKIIRRITKILGRDCSGKGCRISYHVWTDGSYSENFLAAASGLPQENRKCRDRHPRL